MRAWDLLFFLPALCGAAIATDPDRIELKNGCVQPEREGKVLFDGSFRAGSPDWKDFEHFENHSKFVFTKISGKDAIKVMSVSAKASDTAWHFRSRPVPVKAGTKVMLSLHSRTSGPLGEIRGSRNWHPLILWQNGKGETVGGDRFLYPAFSTSFVPSTFIFSVPAGTEKAVIQIGNDNPNLKGEDFHAFSGAVLRELPPQKKFAPLSGFISGPFQTKSGAVRITADIPEGTGVTLQISTSLKPDGGWTPFAGPDGTAESIFRNGDTLPEKLYMGNRFLRAKVILKAGNACPVLRNFAIGTHQESDWRVFSDNYAPEITLTEYNAERAVLTVRDDSLVAENVRIRHGKKELPCTFRDNRITFDLPKDRVPGKTFFFTVEASDVYGNRTVSQQFIPGKKITSPVKVSLRKDGMMLLDGKPFFPIGIIAVAKKPWNGNSYDRAFRDIAEAGFNTAHTYQYPRGKTFYQEFLPAARKYGIKLFVPGAKGANNHDPALLETVIRSDNRYPEIIGWYLADDTATHNTPRQLETMHNLAKSLNPDRLTVQADVIGGFSGYARFSDVFIPELYPVRNTMKQTHSPVAEVIDHTITARTTIQQERAEPKAVWACVQYFKGWTLWTKRFPTPEELRGMSYGTIVAGANGITWYTYAPGNHLKHMGAASTPENWKIMSRVSRELRSLEQVFLAETSVSPAVVKILSGPEKDEYGRSSVHTLLKLYNGKRYLIAVSAVLKPVKLRFQVPGVRSAKILFENRTVPVQNSSFTDDFAPQEVHVYELERVL